MSSRVELVALVAGVVRGDREAFASLYDELGPSLFGVVKRVLQDPAMSEEATQEVFLEIWRTANRFDAERASVPTWAVSIARRRAVDRVRREQSRRNRVVALTRLPANEDRRLEDTVVANDQAERVRSAVAELPADQREVIRLAFFDGHTHDAISNFLGVPLGTVKGRVRSGLKRLRVELATDM